jgi:hypothetical protein
MNEVKNEISEWKGYSFEFRNDAYEVKVRNFEIEQDEYTVFLYADDIKVGRNGSEMTEKDFGTTWSGRKMTEKDLLQQSLALYVNGVKDFSMHESLDELDIVYNKLHEKGRIKDINEAYLTPDGHILHLQFATENSIGYVGVDDLCVAICADSKEPITDIDFFYEQLVYDLVKENTAFIYRTEEFKEWIKTFDTEE